MPCSSARRGQVEPLAALIAVFAVGLGVTAYAGALGTVLVPPERNVAEPALERVASETTRDGAVRPARLAGPDAPDGYELRVTLSTESNRWTAGPRPPERAQAAGRLVSVRVGPGLVEPGRLRVVVWR